MAAKALVSIWNAHDYKWYKIGGDSPDIKAPSDYKGKSLTVVDSGRNAQGEVVGNPIKDDVAKVELKWNYMTVAEFSKLAKLFSPKHNGTFFVACCYFDEVAGTWDGNDSTPPSSSNKCRLFYPSDREAVVAHLTLDKLTGSPVGYENVSLNLIDTGRLFQ